MIILPSNSSGEYEVANSLRFNDGSSDYLSRTPSSAGNRKTFTLSTWLKRSTLDNTQKILDSRDNVTLTSIGFASNNINIVDFNGGTANWGIKTLSVFRDVSAWYHIVVAFDTTQSTASDRIKIYVNGVEQSTEKQSTGYPSQYPDQNEDTKINFTYGHGIGATSTGTDFFDGYMAEVVMIDGTALDPTSFGEFDEDTGIWKPIDVSSLTFGTNGFYLDFENSSSLGADVSGNGNNFTVNNLTSIDQTTDTCTNNYATFNPLDVNSDGVHTLSEGNTKAVNTASAFDQTRSTFYLTTGKWFWETKCTRDGSGHALQVGVVLNNYAGGSGQRRMYQDSGAKYDDGGSAGSYGATWTTNDIIGVALNLDDGEITFYKNGTTQGVAFTDLLTDIDDTGWTPAFISYNGDMSFNFGNPPFTISSGNSDGNGYGNFEYAVPSGYYALNTKNLAEYG